jgi:hypothetical protein
MFTKEIPLNKAIALLLLFVTFSFNCYSQQDEITKEFEIFTLKNKLNNADEILLVCIINRKGGPKLDRVFGLSVKPKLKKGYTRNNEGIVSELDGAWFIQGTKISNWILSPDAIGMVFRDLEINLGNIPEGIGGTLEWKFSYSEKKDRHNDGSFVGSCFVEKII